MNHTSKITRLLAAVKGYYRRHARVHLPWRHTKAPYRILVSEIMLQQTQVDRVVPLYNNFIKKFPTPEALAQAPLFEVLRAWQGLGYNRRAKFLHQAAKIISAEGWSGQKLPGVGPYTAAAVEAFAHNKPAAFVETNIRTVFFYHVGTKKPMSDKELLPLVAQALKQSCMQPRDYYAALMDYGSYLKKQGIRLNSKSRHYAKQSAFEGSARQLRGAILRALLQAPATAAALVKNLGKSYPDRTKEEIARELSRLQKEGMIQKKGASFTIGE